MWDWRLSFIESCFEVCSKRACWNSRFLWCSKVFLIKTFSSLDENYAIIDIWDVYEEQAWNICFSTTFQEKRFFKEEFFNGNIKFKIDLLYSESLI